MASVNKVILIGHLGKDPEVRTFPDGSAVANVSIACSESWKDKTTGEKKESTEWVNLVFHRKLAEIVGQYLKKGSQVYVEGKLKTRKWQDKTTGQDKYTTEVICHEMTMLGSKGDNAGRSAPVSNDAPANGGSTDDTDIPFSPMGDFQH